MALWVHKTNPALQEGPTRTVASSYNRNEELLHISGV